MEKLTIDEIIEHCNRKTESYEKIHGKDSLEKGSLGSTLVKEYWEHRQVGKYLQELKVFRDGIDNNTLLSVACDLGSKVYVLAECKNVKTVLDGTFKTATGYYCPYELYDNCPHTCYECDEAQEITAVFEDTISCITYCEIGLVYHCELTGVSGCIGEYIFLSPDAAKKALKDRSEK